MITNSKLNVEKIKTVFRTMEYNVIKEDTSDVESWLKRQEYSICAYGVDYRKPVGEKVDVNDANLGKKIYSVYVPEDDKKDEIDCRFNDTWDNISNWDSATLMRRFASKIEENADFICKIESLTRGLLPKDTKKYGVSLLVEYLRYFTNWTYSTNRDQRGPTIIYVTDNTCLGALGFALGPALARGNHVILHTEPSLCACVSFLIELFLQLGNWDGVLKLMPTKNKLWTPRIPTIYSHMIYLFGNIQYENNQKLYSYNNVISVSNSKTPIIIFNNSDIDSACECVISAVWEYGGMLPWSADTVLVQEDIYSEFVEKLKQRLEKVDVSDGSNILADISNPPSSAIKKLRQMIDDARVQGIDVHQPQGGNIHNAFKPTLFIGMKVYNNNVIDEYKNVSPAATIIAFRTPKEAIALANNNRQGLAVSLWCDNIALINEITPHLNVGTVWLNSHGIIRASVPFTTYKPDGVGYIGGSLGFYEYDDQQYWKPEYTQLLDSIGTVTFKAKESQIKWNRLTLDDRIGILLKCTADLEQHKSEKIKEEDIEHLRKDIYECITKCSSINSWRTNNGFELIVKREAVGVVVYSVGDPENIPLILGALLLGNAVVLITRTDLPKYQTISRLLPPGLLSVVRPSEAVWLESGSRTVFVNIFRSSSNEIGQIFCELEDWDSIVRRCTLSKNIWMPVGDSI